MADGLPFKMNLKEKNKILIFCDGKKWLIDKKMEEFSTHFGNIKISEKAKKGKGEYEIVNEKKFYFFSPTIREFILKIKRKTQIIYPKDISVMLFYADINEKDKIIEAGTGSGSLLISLASRAKRGKIITIEKREDFQKIAIDNIKNYFGKIPENIEFISRDVYDENFKLGVRKNWADKIFLDLPEPWKAIKILSYLKNGGILVNYNPQILQIKKFIEKIIEMFVDIEVIEILERRWIVDEKRTRPEDLMRGHTGFIMMARKVKNEK